MNRKRGRNRTPAKRTKPTVVRTHLAVIAGIKSNAQGPDLRKEVELVKASLLYADTIDVLSIGGVAVRQMLEFSKQDPSVMWQLLASLDDSTLEHLGVPDVAQARAVLPLLGLLDPDGVRTLAEASPELAPLEQVAEELEQAQAGAGESLRQMRALFEHMSEASGVNELESVVDNKIVRFNERIVVSASKETLHTFLREFKRYLTDPNKFVLLDEEMASLARSMIREGMVQPPDRSMANAGEALLGTGLLARLPAFTSVPLAEVQDLRKDLDEPLSRYRRRVAQLRGQLRGTPFDKEVDAEVNAVWRHEVDPAIADIREAMAEHTLVREIVRSLRHNVGDVVKGWAPVGLGVGLATVGQVDAAVSAAIATAGMATQATVNALENRAEGLASVRAGDFYYLYEVDRRAS